MTSPATIRFDAPDGGSLRLGIELTDKQRAAIETFRDRHPGVWAVDVLLPIFGPSLHEPAGGIETYQRIADRDGQMWEVPESAT